MKNAFKIIGNVNNAYVIVSQETALLTLGEEINKLHEIFEINFSGQELKKIHTGLVKQIYIHLEKKSVDTLDCFTPFRTYEFDGNSISLNMRKDFDLAVLISIYDIFKQTIISNGVLFVYDMSIFRSDVEWSIAKIIAMNSFCSNDTIYANLKENELIDERYLKQEFMSDLLNLRENGIIQFKKDLNVVTTRGWLLTTTIM